jgi:hypothetical protein
LFVGRFGSWTHKTIAHWVRCSLLTALVNKTTFREWDLEIATTSKSEDYTDEGDFIRVFMNVSDNMGDLKAEYIDFESDLEYAISVYDSPLHYVFLMFLPRELESTSSGAILFADVTDDAEAEFKKLFSFDFFNRSKVSPIHSLIHFFSSNTH